ncbi:MAG: hypothetical protein FD139_3644 [Methylocystaceae bacterium]|nr:MAG: hypothetical protein FD139_3644 [Methylocystaceae bacterium]
MLRREPRHRLLIGVTAADVERFPLFGCDFQRGVDGIRVTPVTNIELLPTVDKGKSLQRAGGVVAVVMDLVALPFERDSRTKALRRLRLHIAVALQFRLLRFEICLRGNGFVGLVEQPARLFGELRPRRIVGKRLVNFRNRIGHAVARGDHRFGCSHGACLLCVGRRRRAA